MLPQRSKAGEADETCLAPTVKNFRKCYILRNYSARYRTVIPEGVIGNPQRFCMQYYIYILASRKNGTLYVGVTSDLIKRIYEHKNDLVEGFTQKYTIHNLVYFEATESIESAIMREKQLKKWNRAWKINLIEKNNPAWNDLYPDLI
jgi:putative endonuclease